MKKQFLASAVAAILWAVPFSSAHAADAATLVFRSGIRVYINNGYGKILDAMNRLNKDDRDHSIVQFDYEGGPFLLNVSELVLVCRDRCTTLEVVDIRDPARAKGTSTQLLSLVVVA